MDILCTTKEMTFVVVTKHMVVWLIIEMLFLIDVKTIFLSQKYGCHINIKVCASICAIKYIHKYIYKGHDCTTMQFGREPNEVEQYLDARYVSALEAAWCLFAMDMHEEQPNVVRLVLYFLRMRRVVFNPNDDAVNVLQRTKHESTTLTRFLGDVQ